MDIKLKFINLSNDARLYDVVLFQKNVAAKPNELPVAWKLIRRCGYGNYHPFTFPTQVTVNTSDSYSNHTPKLAATPGQAFAIEQRPSGNLFSYIGASTDVREIEVRNDLSRGAVNANIYRDNRLLGTKTSIAPGQKAVFAFQPTLWIGLVSSVTEGQRLNADVVTEVKTDISLLGIASADLLMMGGGPGAKSTPFRFVLDNVVLA